MFDLIRREAHRGVPHDPIRKTWGGLRQEDFSDLSIKVLEKPEEQLTPYEKEVRSALTHAMDGKERLLLSDLEGDIAGDQTYYAETFSDFREKVGNAVRNDGWWVSRGLKPAIIAC